MTANSILILILPKYIMDSLFTNVNGVFVIKYLIVFITITFILGILNSFIGNRIMIERMDVFKSFQMYLGSKMMDAEFEQIESASFLDLKSRAEKFLYGSGSGFASILESSFDLFGKIFTSIALVGIIMQLNIYLMLMIIIIVIINTYVNIITQKRNIKINLEKSVQERRSQYFSNIFQDFSYGKEIRVYNISEWLLDKYKNQLNVMQIFYKRMAKNNFKYNCITITTSVIQMIVSYWYVIQQAFRKIITVGQFSMYLTTITSFSSTLKDIIFGMVDMQQYSTYYNAFKEYINIKNIFRETTVKPVVSDKFIIEFDNVSFKYKSQSSYAIKNVSIKINSGEKLSIVGRNGAGKSTFIKLLLRIYQPTKGRILLNGVDIQEIDYNYYCSLFSTVFQDYKLFSLSLKENVTFKYTNESEDKNVIGILNQSGMKNKLDCLSNGINTMIYKDFDENGFIPSGGEGQKLAIARAVYRNSPVIILDEPTASLDPQAEYEIYQKFDELFENKTCLYISHRLSSSKLCDRILVFSNGKIVEQGNHDMLFSQNGKYHDLYEMQAKFYN